MDAGRVGFTGWSEISGDDIQLGIRIGDAEAEPLAKVGQRVSSLDQHFLHGAERHSMTMTKIERVVLLALAEQAKQLALANGDEDQCRNGFESAYRDWQRVQSKLLVRRLHRMLKRSKARGIK